MANNGVHIRTDKPPTASVQRPKVRCGQCSVEGRARKDTRTICATCPRKPGLCSDGCFINWHRAQIRLVPAFFETGQLPGQDREGEEGVEQQPEHVPDLRAELISVPPTAAKKYAQKRCGNCSTPQRRKSCRHMCSLCKKGFCNSDCMASYHDRVGCTSLQGANGHNLVSVPKRKTGKTYAQLTCRNCNIRKDRRKMCSQCKMGFCNLDCLMRHHQKTGIFPAPEIPEQVEPAPEIPEQVEPVAGPSGYTPEARNEQPVADPIKSPRPSSHQPSERSSSPCEWLTTAPRSSPMGAENSPDRSDQSVHGSQAFPGNAPPADSPSQSPANSSPANSPPADSTRQSPSHSPNHSSIRSHYPEISDSPRPSQEISDARRDPLDIRYYAGLDQIPIPSSEDDTAHNTPEYQSSGNTSPKNASPENTRISYVIHTVRPPSPTYPPPSSIGAEESGRERSPSTDMPSLQDPPSSSVRPEETAPSCSQNNNQSQPSDRVLRNSRKRKEPSPEKQIRRTRRCMNPARRKLDDSIIFPSDVSSPDESFGD